MAKKIKNQQQVWILFGISIMLLLAGWLMKSFPLLIFFAYSPLFALIDISKQKESFWNHLDLILAALFISLWAADIFNLSHIIFNLIQAIILTLAFAAYLFAYKNLGNRLGKVTIIFFWLGLEYLFLKTPWRQEIHFLADALQLQTTWWQWNAEVGYLSISVWILLVNLIFCNAIFQSQNINWFLIALTLLMIVLPIVSSIVWIDHEGIGREEMMHLYQQKTMVKNVNYNDRGELISRTAAWISVLILLLSLVRNKIRKK